ncbi:MAG TPA: hypothetical protein ENI23_12635 [bacterium]|nr:hypothetical protein [bacterium]
MFWFPTKKQIKKEFKKIAQSFQARDDKIADNSLKIAGLQGQIAVLIAQKSLKVSESPKKSQGNIETKLINRVRRSKKALIIAEIEKLGESCSTIEMYETIVLEKGLCSKASFYRYIASLKKSQVSQLNKIETSQRP